MAGRGVIDGGRRPFGLLLALVGALLALRALAPLALAAYAERVIDASAQYDGAIRDVDLALLRGAYRIEGLEVWKTTGRVPVPLLSVRTLDLSVEWRALMHGEVVAEVHARAPVVNFVDGPSPADDQTGEETDWAERLDALVPIRINRVEIRDGEAHFHAPARRPPVDIALHDVHAVAHDLTNIREPKAERGASVELRAAAFGSGTLSAAMALDPYARQPDFSLRLVGSEIDLVKINDFLRAYAGLDVQRGRLRLVAELDVRAGRFAGYVKPLVDDLDVLRVADELEQQGPLATLWESLVGGVAELFENQPRDQQASRIPVHGTLEQPQVGVFGALRSALRHAFVEALQPGFEDGAGPGETDGD